MFLQDRSEIRVIAVRVRVSFGLVVRRSQLVKMRREEKSKDQSSAVEALSFRGNWVLLEVSPIGRVFLGEPGVLTLAVPCLSFRREVFRFCLLDRLLVYV